MALNGGWRKGMAAGMKQRAPIDDPALAQIAWTFAWSRFRRLMRLLLAVTVAVVTLAGVLLYRHGGRIPVHSVIAAALGIALVMLLASAVMGLVFVRKMAARPTSESSPITLDKGDNPVQEPRQSGGPE